MPYIQDNGVKLWYDITGSGEPLVLTGGYLLLHHQFDWIVDLLAKDFQVISWNYRGAGHSDRRWDGGYCLERYVDDLDCILNSLGLKKVNLWGTSTGSTVTIRYTAKYQERVKSMISYCMITTAAYRKAYQFFTSIGEEFGFEALANFLAWIAVADHHQFTPMANKIALHDARSMQEIVSVESLAKTSETFSHLDLTSELEKVKVPTMLLVGNSGKVGSDNPSVGQLVKDFLEHCKHAKLVTIKDTGGTFSMYEKPEETAEAVKKFIKSLP
ncbi:MAG: alpha/beta hydrolase [Pseudomonadota bacterium]